MTVCGACNEQNEAVVIDVQVLPPATWKTLENRLARFIQRSSELWLGSIQQFHVQSRFSDCPRAFVVVLICFLDHGVLVLHHLI